MVAKMVKKSVELEAVHTTSVATMLLVTHVSVRFEPG
jgi:hypothetical protein